ncbi:uncharacterized protein [Palaemon carinicauda]|uniref:uncharacterized protein n=1 Tax=Palaemon carinicauda TaxID=392227 RepID=UPI0035B5F06E
MANSTNLGEFLQTEESNLDYCDLDIVNVTEHNGSCYVPYLDVNGCFAYYPLSNNFGCGNPGELVDVALMASSGSNALEKNGMEHEQSSSATTVEDQNNEQGERRNVGSMEDENHQTDDRDVIFDG